MLFRSGHIHNREIKCLDPPIVFCGNLQGRHIRETGAKGCYLVTVDDRGKAELEFQPLDVFRWEVCEVAADDADRPQDVLDAFQAELAKRIETHRGIPLGVRVVVTGRSRVHAQLLANPLAWANQIRAAALEEAAGLVWIEKVRVRTAPARELDEDALADGPVGELQRYLHELRSDKTQLAELSEELAELRRRLPDELLRGEETLALNDPDCLRRWLDEIQPLVTSRLVGGPKA